MNWKQHLVALLTINAIWFVISLFVLTNMSWLPLNPDNNPSMSWDLAFNTSVSFVSNTNLQHYSGETGMSYMGQLMLMLWQFISAGYGYRHLCGGIPCDERANNGQTRKLLQLLRSYLHKNFASNRFHWCSDFTVQRYTNDL